MAFSKRAAASTAATTSSSSWPTSTRMRTRETWVHLDMPALGLGYQDTFVAHDLITGQSWHWGEHAFVRLGPDAEPVHVIQMRRF